MKKEVVHTRTLEEYKYVINKIDNKRHLNIFDYEIEGKNTCINLSSGRYRDIKYYKEQGYNIISFNEFKSRYKPQLKIGDTFEKDGFICRVESEVEEKKWYLLKSPDNKTISYEKLGREDLKDINHLYTKQEINNKEFIAQLEKYSQ